MAATGALMIFTPYDRFLAEREATGVPVGVALIGAGNLAWMIAGQLVAPPPPGVRLVAVANRTPERAQRMLESVGVPVVLGDVAAASHLGGVAVAEKPETVVEAPEVDIVIEATGSVEHGLRVVRAAIAARKPVVLANAELDSTFGPQLAGEARRAGVTITNIDGDEPGVAMNLVRYARSLGLRPVAAGNLKGMIDRYRDPDTQREFAAQHGQNPRIMTSFADGTKLAMEAAILANATGFRVGQPGMFGPACQHIREIATRLPADLMLSHGLVDYALGAEPHTGAFVVVHEARPDRCRWLKYLKMGDGPFYVLYTPYHLPHIQIVSTIGRAMQGDPTVTALGPAVCQVVARAKRPLSAGAVLDGPGGFACYGQIENVEQPAPTERPLPIGLATGAVLRRAVARDERILAPDVVLDTGSQAVALWLDNRPVAGGGTS